MSCCPCFQSPSLHNPRCHYIAHARSYGGTGQSPSLAKQPEGTLVFEQPAAQGRTSIGETLSVSSGALTKTSTSAQRALDHLKKKRKAHEEQEEREHKLFTRMGIPSEQAETFVQKLKHLRLSDPNPITDFEGLQNLITTSTTQLMWVNRNLTLGEDICDFNPELFQSEPTSAEMARIDSEKGYCISRYQGKKHSIKLIFPKKESSAQSALKQLLPQGEQVVWGIYLNLVSAQEGGPKPTDRLDQKAKLTLKVSQGDKKGLGPYTEVLFPYSSKRVNERDPKEIYYVFGSRAADNPEDSGLLVFGPS